jgi:hypothetical protein
VKKLILILLLLLVPLQFAWSAAGAYCQHEETTSLHFGHHAHSHQGKHDGTDGKTKITKVHLDCSSCHASASAILDMATFTIAPPAPDYFEPRPISYSSFIPDGPRRPDRFPGA